MTRKEITDAFNSLFLDARKEYLEALKAESKTQYDKFIKDLGKHCIKLVRKMRRQIFRQIACKSIRQALCSVSLIYAFHYFNMFPPKKQVPHPIPYKIFKKHGQHRKTVL